MSIKPDNPVLPLVKEIRETTDLKEVAALLTSKSWVAIAAAPNGDGTYLFCMGRVNGRQGSSTDRPVR